MKKTINCIVMRFHKTALNLIIIDFADIEKAVNKTLQEQLKNWGLQENTLKSSERLKLRLYHYYKQITNTFTLHENNRNIIFYVTDTESKKYLDILSKHFPFMFYYNNLGFDWILRDTGESREILESVKSSRFNFDYSKYTPRKKEVFCKKYKIQL